MSDTLRRRALDLLSRREYSRAELARKLTRLGKDAEAAADAAERDALDADESVDLSLVDTDAAEIPASLSETVNALLDELAETGWQSDQRFAEMWIQAHGRRHGAMRLQQDLRQRGIPAELIQAALAEHQAANPEQDELSRARGVWARKFAQPPSNQQERNKQYRFMLSRGFSASVVSKVLAGSGEDA
jgi:regulatory protein